ncbi:2-oxoglutarate dehydrogenase E2 component (dihydrolipoamide succinyltransferase) [Catalinimonas alkaloidigena]|uniref:Dihydrolipoyllysine-residue succinyltransferase component of 2-oxoglutarate dehydrogenase complex n=1 Tax=Catalinimonas alkaloidigena TaxID=1075417 RepID=A0A1G9DKG9_9BACT|nr:2-oxoglutarate dehydrogenase complex dihydrolipoyllysine-residue succinyltransferase [Catalinimonas alkaloidigena]SDK64356.1 2-oxoglutarate dehydrogenase E2 component (dihydrolipoamide succinyltransferase) [Catalinimonas alkaloidigena]
MSLQEVKVPAVGESITEVTVGTWNKQDGDHVEVDEVLCELESDKATFELNAPVAGTLTIKAQEGDTLEINALICTIDTDGQAGGSDEQPAENESAKATEGEGYGDSTGEAEEAAGTGKVLEMRVPAVGESITEVTIGTWNKQEGDFVEFEEVICEIESDKATFELNAEAAGILHIKAQEGDTLSIGDLICTIEAKAKGGASKAAAPAAPQAQTASAPAASGEKTYATGHPSPAAGKILAEKGIDPQAVKGTGVDGRITKEDALKAQKAAAAAKAAPAEKPAEKSDAPAAAPAPGERNERRQRMSSLRRTVARRLVSVKNETAMLTTFNEVDMKPIMDLRGKYKESFKKKFEVGLGFMSFFTKACCQALQEFPAVNAMIDGDEMIFHDYVDVSIAVSTPKGLVVPVIRNAESMGFADIEKEIIRLATRARDGKLTIEEMQGGTFTITNGGVFGSMLSTPIINAPQSGILGMHNIVERAVVIDGQIVVRPMMYVALSYDHRIIDGRESVSFLVRVKELLEDPARLLLGV